MTAAPEWTYLYGILRDPGVCAVEGCSAIGAPGGPVRVVAHGGLAVLASDSPAERVETTRANMLAHQRVLERVMADRTVLPIRFSTVTAAATAHDDIRRLLAARGAEFTELLADMDGKAEQGLKVFWRDESVVFEGLVARHEPIRRLHQAIQGRPPAATHFERIRLGELVKEAFERHRETEAQSILRPLRRLAAQTAENATIVDRMMLNAAFLVRRAAEPAFDDAIARLSDAHGDRLQFRYVGPVPPYNFVNVSINWSTL